MIVLDMRENPCPIPMITAKRALEKPETLAVRVLVDNAIAVQNLEKMAKGMALTFGYEEDAGIFSVIIEKSGSEPRVKTVVKEKKEGMPTGSATILFKTDKLGEGAPELGQILMKGFIFSLTELELPPENLIFINSGVKLTVEGSSTLEDLKVLEAKGTRLFSCGTCLDFYQLTAKLGIGEIADMYSISGMLNDAGRVITL